MSLPVKPGFAPEAVYRAYLDGLLAHDRQQCRARFQEWLEADDALRSLYDNLVRRSLYEVGDLWERGRISVATEHLATAISEGLLNLTYPRLFAQPRNGKSAVITCVPNEYHLIGPGKRAMMEDNSRNFCRFMGSMFLAYEAEVLAQTALWVFRAYRSHGFHTTYWPANLDTFVEIARDRLSPSTFAETYPFFHWLIVNIPSFVKISDEQLSEPLSPVPSHEPEGRT